MYNTNDRCPSNQHLLVAYIQCTIVMYFMDTTLCVSEVCELTLCTCTCTSTTYETTNKATQHHFCSLAELSKTKGELVWDKVYNMQQYNMCMYMYMYMYMYIHVMILAPSTTIHISVFFLAG